jgi:hypothetical protein
VVCNTFAARFGPERRGSLPFFASLLGCRARLVDACHIRQAGLFWVEGGWLRAHAENVPPVRAEDLVDLVARARAEDLPRLIGDLEAAKAAAFARLTSPATSARPTSPADNVSVDEAAKRLGVSAAYVYKNAATLPFVVRIGRRVVCDSAALERWARQRPGGRASDAR